MKIAPSLLALAVGLCALGAQAEEKARFRVHTDAARATSAAQAAAPAPVAAASTGPAAPALKASSIPAPAGGGIPAPWQGAPKPASAVSPVYLAEWKKAKNRDRCALLAFVGAEEAERDAGIKVRRASFSDGWAVAYDLPGQRSVFGIAGTGVDVDGKGYTFPNTVTWRDGSKASYGLEGGTGPNYLGYLEVAGQRCLYNVWSARGKEHLEFLFNILRKVQTP
ncbi:hypothetical protein J5226_06985 [Lysobacter sp. K5869]|uniref:hypothetical protein n=1 Tax=Lysobacter sp. K5869 TaxID=2820808 RepID=UPI001C0610AD|nr:hypothetical protein [Lysobacter sp. K5869]QWP78134.1 hypothetical protein J5226_06985 [Lysobacter sp. K5869]